MPDIQYNLTATESVSGAVQRIGQALGSLDSTSSRAAGGLAAALGQMERAATATAGAVQRITTQPLRLTDQATPALTHLVTALRELVATRVQIPISVQDTVTPTLSRIRAELASLSAPGALTMTLRDDASPLLAHLRAELGTLAAPAPIPLTVQDQATPVVQRLLADLQRLASTPVQIPVTAAPAPASPRAGAAPSADPAGAQRLAQQAAQAQAAVQSLGTRLDTLQRQLQGIGQTRPTITLTSNYQALQTQIAALQTRLTELSKQPYSIQVRTETAQVRAELTGLQRQFAGFKADLPPLAPRVESGPVEAALGRMQRGFADTGRAAQQHSGAVSSFFSNALSAATGFLAANVFSRITGEIGGLVSGTVQAAASMEQTRAGFTSLLGSAQAADTLIKQLQQEANVSPFELESFRKASQLLLGMGVAADEVVPRLHNVSNVVAAVGGGTEQFDRISLALGQIQAKGKLSAEEVNQLAESGVPAWDLLATALGKTKAQVIDLAQQGRISADTFNAAFAQFANSDAISQAAERNSHTFNGLLSTISDVGQALATAFGTPVLQAVEPVLERIVSSLQDPAVITTLGQWGQAAGNFAVGLINAGQTAFTVAQQIIQALQPVTDFIGQIFGIQGVPAPTLTPPDFGPAAQSAGQFGAAVKQGADQTKSATDQVAGLERQTRELSRATAEANEGYDHRKQSLQDQLTLLDRQYQAENKAADISQLQQKIAKDRALAVDQYSSQGQAAAARLVDEEARLAQLQREQGHDAAKNAIEDRIKSIDREKQATDEASAARTRALQEQMDALRANAAATTALTNAIKPPAAQGPDKSRNRNVNDAFGDAQTQAKGQSLLDLLGQVRDALTGDKGLAAAIGAVGTAWGQLTDAFKASDPGLKQLQTSIGDIAHALGLDAGFAAQSVIAQVAFKQFVETSAALVPQNLAIVGAGLKELNDQLTVTARGFVLLLDKLQGASDVKIGQDLQAFFAAVQGQDADRQRGVAGYLQQAATGQQRTGAITQQNVQDLITGLIEAGKQGTVNSGVATSNRADFGPGARSTNTADFGPGVTTTTSRRDSALAQQHTVRMEFDDNGFTRFVDKATGRALENAVRP